VDDHPQAPELAADETRAKLGVDRREDEMAVPPRPYEIRGRHSDDSWADEPVIVRPRSESLTPLHDTKSPIRNRHIPRRDVRVAAEIFGAIDAWGSCLSRERC
jgi:hypothetical protein